MRMGLGNMRNIPNIKRLDHLTLVPMTLSEPITNGYLSLGSGTIVSISYYALHVESFLVIMFVSFEWTAFHSMEWGREGERE